MLPLPAGLHVGYGLPGVPSEAELLPSGLTHCTVVTSDTVEPVADRFHSAAAPSEGYNTEVQSVTDRLHSAAAPSEGTAQRYSQLPTVCTPELLRLRVQYRGAVSYRPSVPHSCSV